MSFIRPEVAAEFLRLREVIAAAVTTALGLWLLSRGGIVLGLLGLALIGTGLAWVVMAVRRLRFRQDGSAPGIVTVTEAQIAYLGPRIGGFVGMPDLAELHLLTLQGRRVWQLRETNGTALHIPVEAAGAEALFDAFATLPGLDTAALVAALWTDAPSDSNVVALNAANRLIWARSGSGVVRR